MRPFILHALIIYKNSNLLLRRRWEDNIRMDLEEIGISAGNWVDSAQDRECGIEPTGSIGHGVGW